MDHEHHSTSDLTSVCPMHPKMRQTEVGSCPICGLAFRPARQAVAFQPQPQFVHPDRDGNRRCQGLQHGGGSGPDIFPDAFLDHNGSVEVNFEAAAVFTVFVLLGQILRLRAREKPVVH